MQICTSDLLVFYAQLILLFKGSGVCIININVFESSLSYAHQDCIYLIKNTVKQ